MWFGKYKRNFEKETRKKMHFQCICTYFLMQWYNTSIDFLHFYVDDYCSHCSFSLFCNVISSYRSSTKPCRVKRWITLLTWPCLSALCLCLGEKKLLHLLLSSPGEFEETVNVWVSQVSRPWIDSAALLQSKITVWTHISNAIEEQWAFSLCSLSLCCSIALLSVCIFLALPYHSCVTVYSSVAAAQSLSP